MDEATNRVWEQVTADAQLVTLPAVYLRLRAVLLTSLTTIAGLMPLLFETSFQAQFLIPMATSIAFGLAFTTVLVLLVVPALLSLHEGVHAQVRRWLGRGEVTVLERP